MLLGYFAYASRVRGQDPIWVLNKMLSLPRLVFRRETPSAERRILDLVGGGPSWTVHRRDSAGGWASPISLRYQGNANESA
jgi:hypothetical protein